MNEPQGLDQFLANNEGLASGATPPAGLNDFLKEEINQEKYGTLPQQALTAIEGAARGASFGTSDFIASKLSSPEAVKGRIEANPVTSAISNMGGAGALIYGTGGAAAPLESGLAAAKVAPTVATALAYGAEGAAFGAGNVISDIALGDPNLNAEKIMMDVGFGAALGGGLGLLSKGIEALPSLRKAAPVAEEEQTILNTPPKVENAEDVKVPSSIEELQKMNENAQYMGMGADAPAPKVAALENALADVHLDFPVHNLQKQAIIEPEFYNTQRELDTEGGKAIRQYEANQRRELNTKTEQTVQSVSPESKLIEDSRENGQEAIDAFTKQYQDEKKVLIPELNRIKQYESADPFAHKAAVINKITQKMPELARMFDTTGEEIKLNPYKTAYGFDKATYNAIKQMTESLEEPAFIKELINIRKGLEQNIDIMAQGQAPAEIRRLKAVMMDYIQGEAEAAAAKAGENAGSIREIFKRYAINEQQREVIEKAFGASVGSQEFGALSKIKNEKILDKIFANTATVQAAKNILPKEEFNKMLANYLAQEKAYVTTDGVLSSAKWGTFLNKSKADVLNEAFSDNQAALKRLRDLNTISRIVPDKPSINPSGTAKTLWSILDAHSAPQVLSNAKKYLMESFEKRAIAEELNARLAGRAHQAEKMSAVQRIIEKTGKKIEDGAKSIFNDKTKGALRGAAISGALRLSEKDFNEKSKRIKELANDPQALLDHFEKSTAGLQASAPNITAGLNNSITRAVQYLNSKIPDTRNGFLYSPKLKPNDQQIYAFSKAYNVINNPLIAMDQIREGLLTSETMDTLKAVHPALLADMQKAVMMQLKEDQAKELDYPVKLSLSKFLESPLDDHMLPQNIASYQLALAPSGQQAAEASKTKVTLGGLKELSQSENVQTATDKAERGLS